MNGIARKRDCTQSQPEFQIKWYFIHTAYLIPVQRSHYIFSIKCSFPNAFHIGSKNCGIGKKKKKVWCLHKVNSVAALMLLA